MSAFEQGAAQYKEIVDVMVGVTLLLDQASDIVWQRYMALKVGKRLNMCRRYMVAECLLKNLLLPVSSHQVHTQRKNIARLAYRIAAKYSNKSVFQH